MVSGLFPQEMIKKVPFPHWWALSLPLGCQTDFIQCCLTCLEMNSFSPFCKLIRFQDVSFCCLTISEGYKKMIAKVSVVKFLLMVMIMHKYDLSWLPVYLCISLDFKLSPHNYHYAHNHLDFLHNPAPPAPACDGPRGPGTPFLLRVIPTTAGFTLQTQTTCTAHWLTFQVMH